MSERTDTERFQADVGCKDCGLPYQSDSWADLCLDAEEWCLISPSGGEGGLLCANCMVSRARQRGMKHVRAVWNSGPFAAPTLPRVAKPLEEAADVLCSQGMWRLAYKMLRLRDELQDMLDATMDAEEGEG